MEGVVADLGGAAGVSMCVTAASSAFPEAGEEVLEDRDRLDGSLFAAEASLLPVVLDLLAHACRIVPACP
jgi:hypothetical protein